jgi:hypothetical protein
MSEDLCLLQCRSGRRQSIVVIPQAVLAWGLVMQQQLSFVAIDAWRPVVCRHWTIRPLSLLRVSELHVWGEAFEVVPEHARLLFGTFQVTTAC